MVASVILLSPTNMMDWVFPVLSNKQCFSADHVHPSTDLDFF